MILNFKYGITTSHISLCYNHQPLSQLPKDIKFWCRPRRGGVEEGSAVWHHAVPLQAVLPGRPLGVQHEYGVMICRLTIFIDTIYSESLSLSLSLSLCVCVCVCVRVCACGRAW